MPTVTHSGTVTAGGLSLSHQHSRTVDTGIGVQPESDLAAGKSGTLSTRTDDNTGVLTVSTGHGITDANKVTVFWSTGSRYNMTVSGTTGTTISVDGGAGDVLPTADTAIVVDAEETFDMNFDADDAELIAAGGNRRCSIVFYDSGDAVLKGLDISAGEAFVWTSDSGVTAQITGNAVDYVKIANGDSSNALQAKVVCGYDS